MKDLWQCRPQKTKEVVSQSMPPDTILLNLDNGYYYSTNQIGAAIWENCEGKLTIKEMIDDISQRCDVPAEQIEKDILHVIRDMESEGLIHPIEDHTDKVKSAE